MRLQAIAIYVFILPLAPLPALSQPALDFETQLTAALADTGQERGLLHCGGLFRAFGEVSADGTELSDLVMELETDMAVFATVVRENETGETMALAMETVAPAIESVAVLYLSRFRSNHGATGTILDPDLEENLAYCRALHDRLSVPEG